MHKSACRSARDLRRGKEAFALQTVFVSEAEHRQLGGDISERKAQAGGKQYAVKHLYPFLAAYATEPALYDGEYNPNCFEWIACESRDEGVYAWLRKGAGQTILCVMNTQDTAHKKFPLYLSFPAGAEELLNTEAPCWGGADKSKPKALHTSDGGVSGRDYTLTVDLPAMGSRMFKLTPEAPRPEAAQASARRAAAARRKAARTQNAKADAAACNSKK